MIKVPTNQISDLAMKTVLKMRKMVPYQAIGWKLMVSALGRRKKAVIIFV
jgi:hypothetical protein